MVARKLPRLLALAERMLGRRGEADDVAQEAFVRIWKQAPHWQPGRARFDTWLHRVALNLCYDRLRRRRETRRPTTTPHEPPPIPPPRPTQRLQAKQRGRRVAARARRIAGAPARGARAAVLPGAVQRRGRRADGHQRRSARKPARARAPQPARAAAAPSQGETMTPERFRALLDSCGADLRRWPEAERDAARALLASDPPSCAPRSPKRRCSTAGSTPTTIAAPGAALIDRIAGAAGAAGVGRRARVVVAGRAVLAARRLGAHRRWPARSPARWSSRSRSATATRRRDRLAGARHGVQRRVPPTGAKNERRATSSAGWSPRWSSTCSSSARVAGGAARWWLDRAQRRPPPPSRRAACASPPTTCPPSSSAAFCLGLRDARRAVAEPHPGRARRPPGSAAPAARAAASTPTRVAQRWRSTREADMAVRARFEAAVVDFAAHPVARRARRSSPTGWPGAARWAAPPRVIGATLTTDSAPSRVQ